MQVSADFYFRSNPPSSASHHSVLRLAHKNSALPCAHHHHRVVLWFLSTASTPMLQSNYW
ncbi:hypothetical protein K438DRAFT_1798526 [Mycena galopus ATCC 62051]|nr:hypothetical protein K438DRAFT_1798526 [Mycena galopus ATCC 62051]